MSLAEIDSHYLIAGAQLGMVPSMKRIGQSYICKVPWSRYSRSRRSGSLLCRNWPKNLLKFPAHSSCNGSFSVSDEYALNTLDKNATPIEKTEASRKNWRVAREQAK